VINAEIWLRVYIDPPDTAVAAGSVAEAPVAAAA